MQPAYGQDLMRHKQAASLQLRSVGLGSNSLNGAPLPLPPDTSEYICKRPG